MTTFPADDSLDRRAAPPRQLADEVLQSAEDAVLASPASAPPSFAQAPEFARPGPSAGRRWSDYQDAVARQVVERPCQSALMAMVVGALAMVVMRSALNRHRY